MEDTPLPVAITESGTVLRPEFVSLARELAMDIEDEEVIRARYNLTAEQIATLKSNPRFQPVYDRYVQEWNSAANTEMRLRVKSQALLEAGLVKFGAMVTGDGTDMETRIEAAKVLMKTGGIGERANGSGTGERFAINIHLGQGAPQTIEATAIPAFEEGETQAAPVRALPPPADSGATAPVSEDAAGQGEHMPVQQVAQGSSFTIPLPSNQQADGSPLPLQPLSEGD